MSIVIFVLIASIGNNLSVLHRVLLKLQPLNRKKTQALSIVYKVYNMEIRLFIIVSENSVHKINL